MAPARTCASTGVGVSVILPGLHAGRRHVRRRRQCKLPPGVGTSTPEQVARAVVTAIERNRAEVTVAPLPLRLGASIGAVAPGLSAFGQRLAGAAAIARRVSEGQVEKRPNDG